MSAIVLGKRSPSFFEELPSPPSASKKLRCSSSSSPPRFSPSKNDAQGGLQALLVELRSLFPQMDDQTLRRALELSGNNLDSAIRSLNELKIRQTHDTLENFASESIPDIDGCKALEGAAPNCDSSTCSMPHLDNLQASGADWVELFVREMTHSSNVDDARARISKALQALEQNITARSTDVNIRKENAVLKEQVEVLMRENSILKRAVTIQHERQKEYDQKNQELQHLKQLAAEYQEQLKKLEINNYTLMMHLRQAQQSSSIPGRFHPDVF